MRSKELQTVLAAIRTEAGPLALDRASVDRGTATIRSALRTRRRASWLTYNVFCATGDGGGIDPSCKAVDPATGKPEAKTKRTKEIEDAAGQIEFTEERIHEDGIERNDYDAIEEALSDSDREELDQYLEEQAENYADTYEIDDVDVDRDEVAKELGWSDEDVKDKTLEKIDELEEAAAEDDETDWDSLRDKVNEWYKNTNDHGTDAINSLQKEIRRESPDALHDYLYELHDEAGEEIDKSEEEYREMREQELRQEVRDNYDSSDDRREWLRNWYDENYSERGGIEKENVWGRDKDGDRVYGFTTSQGQFYKATVFNEKTSYGMMKNFIFEDEDGSFSKTGKGNALEVFRTISAAATAYVKKEDPDFLTFTAAEKSRQTLYDRLVRTLAGIDGGRVAYATIPQSDKEVRRYVVVKRSRRADLEAILAATPNIPREVLVNAKTKLVRLGPPEDAWFDESAWEEFEPKRTDNAKRPPSPRKNEWRVTIQRLAPYLMELMPDLTRAQSRGIARSIKRGLEFEMQDEEVARLIEAYDIEPERARTIARTEMARAREDGKIGRLKPGQRLRYKLADGACPKCRKVARRLKGRRLTAYQARGIIPVHPNCYCTWETVSAKTGRKITTNESGEARDDILEFARMVENANPEGCNQWTGPDCSTGMGDAESAEQFYINLGEGINSILRSGGDLASASRDSDLEDDLEDVVKQIDSAMKPITEQRITYRGTSIDYVPDVGETFVDKGYFSTSRAKSVAMKFKGQGDKGANVDVVLPVGTKVLDMKNSIEKETLLPRGTKFKVVSKKKITVGWRVKIEVVNDDSPTTNEWNGGDVLEFARMTENVFCATGEGGGVDPSCSSGGKSTVARTQFPTNLERDLSIAKDKSVVTRIHKDFDSIVSDLSETSRANISRVLKDVRVFDSQEAISTYWREQYPKSSTGIVGGFYDWKHGVIAVGGETTIDGNRVSSKGAILHEIAHAIDEGSPTGALHRTDEWKTLWKKHFEGKGYAGTSPSEGFAEAFRGFHENPYFVGAYPDVEDFFRSRNLVKSSG